MGLVGNQITDCYSSVSYSSVKEVMSKQISGIYVGKLRGDRCSPKKSRGQFDSVTGRATDFGDDFSPSHHLEGEEYVFFFKTDPHVSDMIQMGGSTNHYTPVSQHSNKTWTLGRCIFLLNMVIFHCYVSLPEGTWSILLAIRCTYIAQKVVLPSHC